MAKRRVRVQLLHVDPIPHGVSSQAGPAATRADPLPDTSAGELLTEWADEGVSEDDVESVEQVADGAISDFLALFPSDAERNEFLRLAQNSTRLAEEARQRAREREAEEERLIAEVLAEESSNQEGNRPQFPKSYGLNKRPHNPPRVISEATHDDSHHHPLEGQRTARRSGQPASKLGRLTIHQLRMSRSSKDKELAIGN